MILALRRILRWYNHSLVTRSRDIRVTKRLNAPELIDVKILLAPRSRDTCREHSNFSTHSSKMFPIMPRQRLNGSETIYWYLQRRSTSISRNIVRKRSWAIVKLMETRRFHRNFIDHVTQHDCVSFLTDCND